MNVVYILDSFRNVSAQVIPSSYYLVLDIILERMLPFLRRVTSISMANISKLSRWAMKKAVKLY